MLRFMVLLSAAHSITLRTAAACNAVRSTGAAQDCRDFLRWTSRRWSLLLCSFPPDGSLVLPHHAGDSQPILSHPFTHTVLSGDVFHSRSPADLCQEQCAGQEETSGQPGGLFLLDRVTGQERDVTQPLN